MASAETPAVRIYASNRFEPLAALLAENLRNERPLTEPARLFEPARVVVPSVQVAQYLRFELADALGVAANVEFPFLRAFLRGLLKTELDAATLVEGEELLNLLLGALADDALIAGIAEVERYLGRAPGTAETEAQARRRFQLAQKLAGLWSELAVSRRDVLEGWSAGKVTGEGKAAAIVNWQQALWAQLFGPAGRFAAERARPWDEGRWALAPEAWAEWARRRAAGGTARLPRALHVFGFAHLGRGYLEILKTLAPHCPVHLYAMTPCADYAAVTAGAATPLHRWGRPGWESLRMMGEVLAVAPNFVPAMPAADSLLGRLQADALAARPPRKPEEPLPGVPRGDASVTFVAAPGVRREIEAAADLIWQVLKDEADLRFHEIAVFVAGDEAPNYLAQIPSVFTEYGGIPAVISGGPANLENSVYDAVDLLLNLPLSPFRRRDVFEIMAHPAVAGQFPGADQEQWKRWLDAVGIYRAPEKSPDGESYIKGDLYNWDQGLRRLTLGAWMTGPRIGEERLYDEAYRVEDYAGSDAANAGRFVALARSLIADAQWFRDLQVPLAQWAALLGSAVATYLRGVREDERRDMWKCVAQLEALGAADLTGAAVPYAVAHEYARAAVAGLRSSAMRYLAGGVAVAPFDPMRSVPFKVIFVLGLGEGKFPAKAAFDPLDLRGAGDPAPGEYSKRDQDKYTFLEALLAARKRVYLSYVARDPKTGEKREPASLVRELQYILDRDFLGKGGASARTITVPLQRFDAEGFTASIEAREEYEARRLHADLKRHLAKGEAFPRAPGALATAPVPVRERLAGLGVAVKRDLPPVPAEDRDTVRVSISTLKSFLKCPMQGWAEFGLRLEEAGDDALAAGDEPLMVSTLDRAVLLRDAFLQSGAKLDEAGKKYDAQFARRERGGQFPTGVFKTTVAEEHKAILTKWIAEDLPLDARLGQPFAKYRFGPARMAERNLTAAHELVLENIKLGARVVRVQITGTSELVSAGGDAVLLLETRGKYSHEDWLKGFLSLVCVTAAGDREPGPARVYALCKKQSGVLEIDAFDRAAAAGYLRALVEDLLTQVHDYFWVAEAAIVAGRANEFDAGNEAALKKRLADAWANAQGSEFGGSADYGPVREWAPHPPPAVDDAKAIFARRYQFYLAHGGTGNAAGLAAAAKAAANAAKDAQAEADKAAIKVEREAAKEAKERAKEEERQRKAKEREAAKAAKPAKKGGKKS